MSTLLRWSVIIEKNKCELSDNELAVSTRPSPRRSDRNCFVRQDPSVWKFANKWKLNFSITGCLLKKILYFRHETYPMWSSSRIIGNVLFTDSSLYVAAFSAARVSNESAEKESVLVVSLSANGRYLCGFVDLFTDMARVGEFCITPAQGSLTICIRSGDRELILSQRFAVIMVITFSRQ